MEQNIKVIIDQKIKQKRRFYSFEITPTEDVTGLVSSIQLQLATFNPPLFVSVSCIGDKYLQYSNVEDSPALRTIKSLPFPGKTISNLENLHYFCPSVCQSL